MDKIRLSLAVGSVIAILGWGGWLAATRLAPEDRRLGDPVTISNTGQAKPESDEGRQVQQFKRQIQRLTEQLHAQQRDLERQQEAIAQVSNKLALGTGTDGTLAGDKKITPQVSEEERQKAEEAQEQERLFQLDTKVNTEAVDSEWGRAAQDEIAGVLETESLKGSRLLGTGCRSTLCRLEVLHSNGAAMDSFISEFPLRLGWRKSHSHFHIQHNPDASISTIVYISRESYPLFEVGN